MFQYNKILQYPINIKNPNPTYAKIIISQYGGPDGELGASLRYLSQRFAMPTRELQGLLTDIGTEELSHLEMHKYFEDSIGMVSDWKKRGPIYEVPFRTLYSNKVKNLICAGRCTSTNETLWDVMRVIPCCAVTGQAAGTAAAMTDDFTTLDVITLQEQLVKDGVVLHESEIL